MADGMTERPDNIIAAEVCLPSTDLTADLACFTETLGFRLDTIFPADDPAVATLSGYGVRLRLERGSTVAPGVLRLLCRDPDGVAAGQRELTAPNGVRVVLVDAECAGRAAADRPRVRGAAAEGQGALGHRPGRDGVSGSDSRDGWAAASSPPTSASPTPGRCPTWCTTTRSAFS